MAMLASTNISDWLIITATILGPILAVQAQKWVERGSRKRDQRLYIFRTLMTTRGNKLSRDHVDALNAITLAFDDGGPRLRGQKCQLVLDRWKEYLSHLSTNDIPQSDEGWRAHDAVSKERFLNLLDAMSKERGYAIDRVELEKGGYYPVAMVNAGAAGEAVMAGALKVFSGEQALRIHLEGSESANPP